MSKQKTAKELLDLLTVDRLCEEISKTLKRGAKFKHEIDTDKDSDAVRAVNYLVGPLWMHVMSGRDLEGATYEKSFFAVIRSCLLRDDLSIVHQVFHEAEQDGKTLPHSKEVAIQLLREWGRKTELTEVSPKSIRQDLAIFYPHLLLGRPLFFKFGDDLVQKINELQNQGRFTRDLDAGELLHAWGYLVQPLNAELERLLPELKKPFEERITRVHWALSQIVNQWREQGELGALERMADHSLFDTLRVLHESIHDAPVLVVGETGTGKELIANGVHELSDRKDKPLRVVNLATTSDEHAISRLFGHVKGAFTGAVRDRPGQFELAEGSTLFLDEIDKASPRVQGMLLRAIAEEEFTPLGSTETKKCNVRIIAATNQDLEDPDMGFLEDLYFRLRPDFRIVLRPLHRRSRQDLKSLWSKLCEREGELRPESENEAIEAIKWVSENDLDFLTKRAWKGNVRSLEDWVGAFVRDSIPAHKVISPLAPQLSFRLAEAPALSAAEYIQKMEKFTASDWEASSRSASGSLTMEEWPPSQVTELAIQAIDSVPKMPERYEPSGEKKGESLLQKLSRDFKDAVMIDLALRYKNDWDKIGALLQMAPSTARTEHGKSKKRLASS